MENECKLKQILLAYNGCVLNNFKNCILKQLRNFQSFLNQNLFNCVWISVHIIIKYN